MKAIKIDSANKTEKTKKHLKKEMCTLYYIATQETTHCKAKQSWPEQIKIPKQDGSSRKKLFHHYQPLI